MRSRASSWAIGLSCLQLLLRILRHLCSGPASRTVARIVPATPSLRTEARICRRPEAPDLPSVPATFSQELAPVAAFVTVDTSDLGTDGMPSRGAR